MYSEVSHRIVVSRHVLVCILKYRIVLSCNGVYFEVSYRIVMYRHVSVVYSEVSHRIVVHRCVF